LRIPLHLLWLADPFHNGLATLYASRNCPVNELCEPRRVVF
jgi:hypothetical protein